MSKMPPRVWLAPKARGLKPGYTMFAHAEKTANDFEAWIPEREHEQLMREARASARAEERAKAFQEAVAYLHTEHAGVQHGTKVSYFIAAEILRVWAEKQILGDAARGEASQAREGE